MSIMEDVPFKLCSFRTDLREISPLFLSSQNELRRLQIEEGTGPSSYKLQHLQSTYLGSQILPNLSILQCRPCLASSFTTHPITSLKLGPEGTETIDMTKFLIDGGLDSHIWRGTLAALDLTALQTSVDNRMLTVELLRFIAERAPRLSVLHIGNNCYVGPNEHAVIPSRLFTK
jgi:hypothetical protein